MSYKVEHRRKKVKQYMLKGFSPREIALKLNESYFVICNDLRIIKSKMRSELLKESDLLKDVLYQTKIILDKYKEIEKAAWNRIEEGNLKPQELSSLLTLLKNIHSDVSRLLLLVEPSKTVINVNEFIQINIMPVLRKVAEIIETYVPEEKRYQAIVDLEQLIRKTELIEKDYGKNENK